MDLNEAFNASKAVIYQVAALANVKISTAAETELTAIVSEGIPLVTEARRKEAVGNFLRFLAAAIEDSESEGDLRQMSESSLLKTKERICPIYPFK